jgi:hypothetical protein
MLNNGNDFSVQGTKSTAVLRISGWRVTHLRRPASALLPVFLVPLQRAVPHPACDGRPRPIADELLQRRFVLFVDGLHRDSYAAHLVKGLLAPTDALGGLLGFRELPAELSYVRAHRCACLWQRDRSLVCIAVLPTEIPVRDPHYGLLRTIEQHRSGLHFLCNIVRVGAN